MFVMETDCVLCEVQSAVLAYIIYVEVSLQMVKVFPPLS